MEGQRNAWQLPGYTRIREIGDDGRVVLARRDADGAEVVLERLDARPGEEAAAGFRADAERLASADDPHLIRPRECVTGEAGAAIVRDAAEGEPLRRILGRAGPLGPEAALVLLHDILRGLAAAHRAGVAHRDLRPEHVLVAADGTARLTGFGVAHLARPAAGPYRPPGEEEPAGPAADLYAAAVTFAESLSGRPPRSGEDAAAAERVPGPLRDLVRYGTATRAGDGPESAEAFLDRLAEAAVAGYGPDWQERGRAALRPSPEPPAGRRPFGLAALSLLTPAAKLAVVGAVSVLTVLAILAVFAILGEPAETGSRAVPEVPVAETGPMTESPSSGSATPGHSPDRAGRSETTRPPEPARSRTSAAGGERVRPGDRPRTSRPAPSGSRTPAPTRRPSRTPTSSVTGSATPSAAPTTRPTSRPTSRPTPRPTLPSEPPTEGPGGGGTPTSEPERPTPAPEEPGGEPSTS
jgi:serine/threonine-protein kinase